MDDLWVVLRAEANAEENTFTLAIRDYRWDPGLFARLEAAMRRACEALAEKQSVERCLVRGF